MAQSFLDRYSSETTWHNKAIVMGLYHSFMSYRGEWTITATAQYFGCSIGLVSENLKLANAIHQNEKILECKTRQEALRWLNGKQIRPRGTQILG